MEQISPKYIRVDDYVLNISKILAVKKYIGGPGLFCTETFTLHPERTYILQIKYCGNRNDGDKEVKWYNIPYDDEKTCDRDVRVVKDMISKNKSVVILKEKDKLS